MKGQNTGIDSNCSESCLILGKQPVELFSIFCSNIIQTFIAKLLMPEWAYSLTTHIMVKADHAPTVCAKMKNITAALALIAKTWVIAARARNTEYQVSHMTDHHRHCPHLMKNHPAVHLAAQPNSFYIRSASAAPHSWSVLCRQL